MHIRLLAAALWVSASAGVLAQPSENAARAQEALARARAAIGEAGKMGSLRSLTISGTARRLLGEREASSEITLDILLPDKVKRTVFNSPFPGVEFTVVEALNGSQVWFDSTLPASGGNMTVMGPPGGGPGGGSGPQMVIIGGPMAGPGGPAGGPGGDHPTEARQQATRVEFTRLMLGLLAVAPAAVPVEYAYVGEAKAQDGTADVIEVKGPGNAATRLFIDKATGRMLMLNYRGKEVQTVRRMGRPPGSAPSTPEEAERLRKETAEQLAKAPDVEFYWRFGDYRNVGGLMLPHLITRSAGEKIIEEWAISKYKLNPSLKAGSFEKKQ